ncbi:hypothetical protein [Vulgatibacter sp.]|uniref:hypothetical protein n=1 Tax=Vulgatibacter sp. TaxID=1971226 RepID=UPI00356894EF
MFVFFSNRLGCLGSIVVSLIGTALLFLLLRSCTANEAAAALDTEAAIRSQRGP